MDHTFSCGRGVRIHSVRPTAPHFASLTITRLVYHGSITGIVGVPSGRPLVRVGLRPATLGQFPPGVDRVNRCRSIMRAAACTKSSRVEGPPVRPTQTGRKVSVVFTSCLLGKGRGVLSVCKYDH